MAYFISTVLHWYKKKVANFTQSNKKCAYMHMYNFSKEIHIRFIQNSPKKFCIVTVQF